MKTIITPGKINQTTYQNNCNSCGCIYTYQAEDIEYNCFDGTAYVKCPCCDRFNYTMQAFPNYIINTNTYYKED